MPDDFIPRRSGASGPFQTRKIVGGVEGGPFPNTPEESWLWLKERLAAGDNINLQYDDENRQILIHGQSGGVAEVLWGGIGGTLAHQSDLQTALGGKAAASHTHPISQITNLQSSLDAKAALTQVLRHDINQTLALQSKLRAARNAGALVTLSAELIGHGHYWHGLSIAEWLWTVPETFAFWDLTLAAFSNTIAESWTCDVELRRSEELIWSGTPSFEPEEAVSVIGFQGGLILPYGQPFTIEITSQPPYDGNIYGLQVHARGIWV